MMQVYKYPGKKLQNEIVKRPLQDISFTEKKVRKILENVKKKGDPALQRYSEKFDGNSLKDIQVSGKEMNAAGSLLDEKLKKAIQQAKKNIELFHT
ncbi:MAG TPA: histidinol dehydrogenase, partial [Chitinophagaceae bacterium]|nr:histidinol dehydrogenase [Chitinophagaceae bacterium]